MRQLKISITIALWVLCAGCASSSLFEGFLHYDVDEYETYYKNGHVYVLYVVKSYRKDWSTFDPIIGIEPDENIKAEVYYLLDINIHTGESSQREIYSTSGSREEGSVYHLGVNHEGELYPLISVSIGQSHKKLLNEKKAELFQYSDLLDARGCLIGDTVFYSDLEGRVCRYDFCLNESKVIMSKHEYETLMGDHDYKIYNTDVPHFRAFAKYHADTEVIDLVTGRKIASAPIDSVFITPIRMDGTNACWAIKPEYNGELVEVHHGDQVFSKKLKHRFWNNYLTVFDIKDGCTGLVGMWHGELDYVIWFYKTDRIISGTVKPTIMRGWGRFTSTSVKSVAQPDK